MSQLSRMYTQTAFYQGRLTRPLKHHGEHMKYFKEFYEKVLQFKFYYRKLFGVYKA